MFSQWVFLSVLALAVPSFAWAEDAVSDLAKEQSKAEQGDKRGIHIEWARRGRSGMMLWDDSGCWKGFPEKIETAVYGGLTVEDMERIEDSAPASFASAEDAISWGFERGAFRDAVHAKNSYDKLKAEKQPKTAQAMWDLWKAKVQAHLDEIAEEAARSGEHVFSDEEMENA